MTAKEYLLRYKWARREAADMELRITQLRLRYGAPSAINYSDMPKAHNNSDLSDYAVELEQLTDYLIEKYQRCIGIEVDVYKRVDSMSDQLEREVLRLRYIDITPQGRLLDWKSIAARMHYDVSTVVRIHGQALKHFPLDNAQQCAKV